MKNMCPQLFKHKAMYSREYYKIDARYEGVENPHAEATLAHDLRNHNWRNTKYQDLCNPWNKVSRRSYHVPLHLFSCNVGLVWQTEANVAPVVLPHVVEEDNETDEFTNIGQEK